MIGTSRLEFYFIRVCIIGLHYLAPLCLLYCALVIALYGFKTAFTSPFPLVIEGIAAAESLFFLCVYIPYRIYLQREAVHPPAPNRDQRRELFRLCDENIKDPELYLHKWFLGANAEDIKRENLKEFLLWAFFNRGGLPGDDNEELEEYVVATEKLLGRPIEPGRGKAQCLRLTLDGVEMLHRSLIWYCCVGFVDFLTHVRLRLHGFHFHRTKLSRFFYLFPFRFHSLFTSHHSPAKYTTYWHRPHTSKTKLPVVFIHGIGIGLYPYTKFLNELNNSAGINTSDPDEQVGIIAIEIMPVSFRICHHALDRAEMCSEIDQIVSKEFGPDQKFVLTSHSYGTVITTHLLNTPSIAERIGPVVLIDPVTMLLHLPDVAYNFTRRQPKHANEHQLYYFASMDMGVSHTLSRHFFWNENVLWKHDFGGRKVTVSLGGRDLIVDTQSVGAYLADDGKGQANGHTTNRHAKGSGALIEIEIDDNDEAEESNLSTHEDDIDEESVIDEEEWKSRPWKGEGIDILWLNNLDHAQVFDKPATRRMLVSAIRTYCQET